MTVLTIALGTFIGNTAFALTVALLSIWVDYQKEKTAIKRSEALKAMVEDRLSAEAKRMENYAKMES
jgi:hypothetical protein